MEKKNERLAYLILKILEERFLNSKEICKRLRLYHADFDDAKLYPTLSHLQLSNCLCTNWLNNGSGNPEKYYHITRNGLRLIHSNKFNL